MPKLDKEEALKKARILLDEIASRPMTVFKKEIKELPSSALNQLISFLEDTQLSIDHLRDELNRRS